MTTAMRGFGAGNSFRSALDEMAKEEELCTCGAVRRPDPSGLSWHYPECPATVLDIAQVSGRDEEGRTEESFRDSLKWTVNAVPKGIGWTLGAVAALLLYIVMAILSPVWGPIVLARRLYVRFFKS